MNRKSAVHHIGRGLGLFALSVLLSGCARLEIPELFSLTASSGSQKQELTADTSKGEYLVYYSDKDSTGLEGRIYVPESQTFDGIVEELTEQFQKAPDETVISALPGSVSINGYTMGVDNLTIDFNAAYLGLGNVQEVLLRAGIVKTLVQLPGVQNVSVTVDSQPLKEPDGSVIGAMNEDTFIDPMGEEINSVHQVDMTLFFGAPDGRLLQAERRSSTYSTNIITERIIAEQLIRGPEQEGLLPVCYPDVPINSITVEDGICWVDLGSRFNAWDEAQMASPELSLYAFVNSILTGSEAGGVVFRIDGKSDVQFRDQLSLELVYTRNKDLIGGAVPDSIVGIEPEIDDEAAEEETEK